MTEQGAMVALIIVNWEYSEPRQLEPLLYPEQDGEMLDTLLRGYITQ